MALRPHNLLLFVVTAAACGADRTHPSEAELTAGIDQLNAAIVQTHRNRDPAAYAALHTDSAVFEWPAFANVRGRAGLEALMRDNWANRNQLDLEVSVTARTIGLDRATQFAAYRESWLEPNGVRTMEFGRFVVTLVGQPDGGWLVDRFFGFSDSTTSVADAR